LSIRLVGMGFDDTVRGTYTEIVRPERIAYTMRFDDLPRFDISSTITFAARGPRATTLTMRQAFPPWEKLTADEAALLRPRRAGAPIGWGQALDHLASVIAS
jgi:uncharacterized protein YndB with AHSA1/START domain